MGALAGTAVGLLIGLGGTGTALSLATEPAGPATVQVCVAADGTVRGDLFNGACPWRSELVSINKEGPVGPSGPVGPQGPGAVDLDATGSVGTGRGATIYEDDLVRLTAECDPSSTFVLLEFHVVDSNHQVWVTGTIGRPDGHHGISFQMGGAHREEFTAKNPALDLMLTREADGEVRHLALHHIPDGTCRFKGQLTP